MKYSIATVCLSGTLREKLEAIAKAGFSAVEMMEKRKFLFNTGSGLPSNGNV